MDKYIFRTLIKNDGRYPNFEFVQGRIVGMQYVICDKLGKPFGMEQRGDNWILTTECDEDAYLVFSGVVEEWYPGLCVFDYISGTSVEEEEG